MGAAVVAGDDRGGKLITGKELPGSLGPGLLGVVTGEDLDAPGQPVAAHGGPVATPALVGAWHGAAVHVRDGPMAKPGQVVDGLPQAIGVGGSHAVHAGGPDTAVDVDDRYLLGDRRQLSWAGLGADHDDRLAAHSQQILHGLLFVAPGRHGAEHDGVTAPLGGGVERLDDVHVVRVAHGEQHPQLPAAGAPQKLRRGVGTVAQFPGHLEHALARLRTGPGLVAEDQRHQ